MANRHSTRIFFPGNGQNQFPVQLKQMQNGTQTQKADVKSERDGKRQVLGNAKIGHSWGNSKLHFAENMEVMIFLRSTVSLINSNL